MTAPNRLIAELPTNTLICQVLVWQPVGIMLLVCHVLLVRTSIWFFPLLPIVLGFLYYRAQLAGALVFFQILIYQNMIISLFSPGMEYLPTYVILGGTNFVALCTIAIIALSRLAVPYWWQQSHRLIWLVLAALAMTALYTLIGASKVGPTSATVYFRAFTSPLLAVLVGLDLGRTWGYKTIGTGFIFSVVLSIALSIVEYCIPLDFYAWMNEVTFYQLKYTMQPTGNTFYVPQDIVRHFTNAFFNVSGSRPNDAMTTFRFGGSIITPTSFAYVLSVVGLVAVSVRRSAWLLIILPLMFLVGAKGASLLLILSLLLWWVWKRTCSTRVLVVSGIVLSIGYVAFGLVAGMHNNDYHVAGFLGGVHSLIANPFGHGIGVGGNMSAEANAGFKMDGPGGFTRMGADFALESAVGVLFYQTGLASLLIFAVFIALLNPALLGEPRGGRVQPATQDILFVAVAMIMVNGVFQEEAYSPYAAGTIMLLCSCIVGNGRRQHLVYTPTIHTLGYKKVSA